jgi:hypothetical protein
MGLARGLLSVRVMRSVILVAILLSVSSIAGARPKRSHHAPAAAARGPHRLGEPTPMVHARHSHHNH